MPEKYIRFNLIQKKKIKNFRCDICDRPCKSRYLLEVHKTQHIAEKPYECDICAQKFATKLLIYFHMYKHHSGKPSPAHRKPRKQPQKGKRKPTVASLPIKKSYQCVQCTESFDKKSTLKTHRERVHGHHEHICDICGKYDVFIGLLEQNPFNRFLFCCR